MGKSELGSKNLRHGSQRRPLGGVEVVESALKWLAEHKCPWCTQKPNGVLQCTARSGRLVEGKWVQVKTCLNK